MNKSRLLGALCASVFSFITTSSHATLITFGFAGTVSSISDVTNALGGSVDVGTVFSGQYNFESTTVGTCSPICTSYFPAVTSATVTIGGNKFDRSGLNSTITVADGAMFASSSGIIVQADIYQVVIPLFTEFAFSITLVDSFNTAFNDMTLPLVPPDIAKFDPQNNMLLGMPHQFEIHEQVPSGTIGIAGIITSIYSVPVPAAVWLFGSGLLGLVCLAKRKKAA